jgi:hypothetical protein
MMSGSEHRRDPSTPETGVSGSSGRFRRGDQETAAGRGMPSYGR